MMNMDASCFTSDEPYLGAAEEARQRRMQLIIEIREAPTDEVALAAISDYEFWTRADQD